MLFCVLQNKVILLFLIFGTGLYNDTGETKLLRKKINSIAEKHKEFVTFYSYIYVFI